MHVPKGKSGDQLPEVVEDENNDRDVLVDDDKNVDCDNNFNGDVVEDDSFLTQSSFLKNGKDLKEKMTKAREKSRCNSGI